MLAGRYETVVAEDLNVAGMTRNRRLARAISDQGFGTARRMLALQDRLARRDAGPRGPVVSVVEDLLGAAAR